MEEELPEHLKLAKEQIDDWHKEQNFKRLIGKYYSKHEGMGYPTYLRRIFVDKNNEVRVDEYHRPNNHAEFHFRSWTIQTFESINDTNYKFSEIEGKNYYDILDNYLSKPELKCLMVTKQGDRIKFLNKEIQAKNKHEEEVEARWDKLLYKIEQITNTIIFSPDNETKETLIKKLKTYVDKNVNTDD